MNNRPSFLHLALICALGLVQFTSMPNAALAAGTRVTVPDETLVEVAPLGALNTYAVAKGSTFLGLVKKDVVVDGFIIIKAGALAQGTVVDSVYRDISRYSGEITELPKRRGLFGVSGDSAKAAPLRIRFDWVTGVDGLKLVVGDITTDGDRNGNPAQTIAAPDYLVQPIYKSEKHSIFNDSPEVYRYGGDGWIMGTQIFVARIKGPVHTVTSLKAGDPATDGFAH